MGAGDAFRGIARALAGAGQTGADYALKESEQKNKLRNDVGLELLKQSFKAKPSNQIGLYLEKAGGDVSKALEMMNADKMRQIYAAKSATGSYGEPLIIQGEDGSLQVVPVPKDDTTTIIKPKPGETVVNRSGTELSSGPKEPTLDAIALERLKDFIKPSQPINASVPSSNQGIDPELKAAYPDVAIDSTGNPFVIREGKKKYFKKTN